MQLHIHYVSRSVVQSASFVWVELCLLTYHKPDGAAQRLLTVLSVTDWGSPFLYYFICCLTEMVGIIFFLVFFC